MIGFFAAVDAIAARFTRLIGIGASLALARRYESDLASSLLKIGIDFPQVDHLIQRFVLIVVAVFALMQGGGVAVLIGESVGRTFIGKRNILFFTVVPVVAVITALVIGGVNQVATEVMNEVLKK